MIIIRQRLFSEYPSTWQRIKKAGNAGIQGLAYGAIPGGTVGLLGGKKGAVIGALTTGIPIGAISATASWKGSSKSSIDQENKYIAKTNAEIAKFEKDAVKDPKWAFAQLAGSREKIAGYKNLEKKYGIEFPSEFYKFIKLQEDFIPIAVKWVKDNNGKSSYYWNDVIPLVYDPEMVKDWISHGENVFDVIYFEDHSDDFIAYCPETKEFMSWGMMNDGTNLKQAFLKFIDVQKLNCSDNALRSLAKLYENFIRTRL